MNHEPIHITPCGSTRNIKPPFPALPCPALTAFPPRSSPTSHTYPICLSSPPTHVPPRNTSPHRFVPLDPPPTPPPVTRSPVPGLANPSRLRSRFSSPCYLHGAMRGYLLMQATPDQGMRDECEGKSPLAPLRLVSSHLVSSHLAAHWILTVVNVEVFLGGKEGRKRAEWVHRR